MTEKDEKMKGLEGDEIRNVTARNALLVAGEDITDTRDEVKVTMIRPETSEALKRITEFYETIVAMRSRNRKKVKDSQKLNEIQQSFQSYIDDDELYPNECTEETSEVKKKLEILYNDYFVPLELQRYGGKLKEITTIIESKLSERIFKSDRDLIASIKNSLKFIVYYIEKAQGPFKSIKENLSIIEIADYDGIREFLEGISPNIDEITEYADLQGLLNLGFLIISLPDESEMKSSLLDKITEKLDERFKDKGVSGFSMESGETDSISVANLDKKLLLYFSKKYPNSEIIIKTSDEQSIAILSGLSIDELIAFEQDYEAYQDTYKQNLEDGKNCLNENFWKGIRGRSLSEGIFIQAYGTNIQYLISRLHNGTIKVRGIFERDLQRSGSFDCIIDFDNLPDNPEMIKNYAYVDWKDIKKAITEIKKD